MARIYVLSGDDLGAVREVVSGAVIGRGRDVEVPVRGASISRRHARLEERGGRWYVVDLGSSNGTRVAGRAVEEAPLEDGEEFLLGDVEVRFRVGVHAPPTTPAPASTDEEGAVQRAETTFLGASPAVNAESEPGLESEPDSDELELEGDWDDSVPAPPPALPRASAPPAAPRPKPAATAQASPERSAADAAHRRAEAMGGPVAGARGTTSGGRILQYQRVENRSGLFGVDLAQLPAGARFGLYALVLVGFAALAWGAFQLTATAKRASAPPPLEDAFQEG